eukprot:jgi/Bigna1/147076/aug1.128_g21784
MVSFLVAIASRDDGRAGVSEATASSSSSSSFRSIYVVSTLVFVVGFTAFVGVQLLVGSRHPSTNPSLSCPSSCSKNSFAHRWVGPKIQVPAALESFSTQQVRAYLLGTKEAEQALTYKAEYCKIVYFVRHGQGYHNLGKRSPVDKLARCNDMDLFDASLTSVGEDQASRIQDISLKLRPEIIYVSPMRRTLQTGTLAFKTVDVPFIAFEELREVYGCTSSQRRKASIAKAEFPKVDFSRITEDDLEWTAVESPGHLKERQIRFLNYIRNRPERTLGVVTHSLWLLNFFRETVACTEPALTNSIFNTGELKGVVLQMDGFD